MNQPPKARPRRGGRLPFVSAVTAAALATALIVAGCSSSAKPAAGSSTPTASGTTIVIKNFAFVPSDLAVTPGTTVTVRNEDPATHTLTATGPHGRVFDTGDMSEGATATFTAPATPGSYAYICEIHQFMHGTLTVK